MWVFDDAATGLVREPFISGADNILDVLTENIPDAANGFKIIFSARPFPGYTARFVWTRTEYGGNWYRWPRGKWKDGCVRPCSNTSKALPKKSSFRRPPKAREIRRCAQHFTTALSDALFMPATQWENRGEPANHSEARYQLYQSLYCWPEVVPFGDSRQRKYGAAGGRVR